VNSFQFPVEQQWKSTDSKIMSPVIANETPGVIVLDNADFVAGRHFFAGE
jgi:hypothetical protein